MICTSKKGRDKGDHFIPAPSLSLSPCASFFSAKVCLCLCQLYSAFQEYVYMFVYMILVNIKLKDAHYEKYNCILCKFVAEVRSFSN